MNIVKKLAGLAGRHPISAKAKLLSALSITIVLGSVGTYVEHNIHLISKSWIGPVLGVVTDKTESGSDIAGTFESGSGQQPSGATGGAQGATSDGKKAPTPASNGAKPPTGALNTKPSGGGTAATPPSSGQPVPGQPASTANDKFGMSAPNNKWSERLAQVGPSHIKFRRLFFQSFTDNLGKVSETLNAGMTPVISWKTGGYSWSQVASGAADSQLNSLVSQLNAIPGPKVLVVHHEPAGDGTAQDFVAMQLHVLPILANANQSSVGIIGNGWWWSARSQGYTDAELAQWIPTSVKNVSDFVAADTYQDENLDEDGSVKATRMAAWAKRTGGVSALGIGEFNGFTASSVTNVMNVVKAEPLFKWAMVWNSGPSGLGTPLDGERLQAFINGKATPDQT